MHANDNTNASLQRLASRMQELETDTKDMRKKKRRDDSKIWFDAEETFLKCTDHLQLARLIAGLLRHPELKEKLSSEQFNSVVLKAKELAGNMTAATKNLKALREQHLEIAKKYPLRQKKRRGTTETLDYLTVAEGYMSWMEDSVATISGPALEIIAYVSEAGITLQEEEEPVAPPIEEKPIREKVAVQPKKRPAPKKRVKRKHARPKKK